MLFRSVYFKFGNIRLGQDTDKPEFTSLSYFAMIFSCGVAVGLFVYGTAEPLYHYGYWYKHSLNGNGYESDVEAANMAILTTVFHWGFHGWVVYSLVAISLLGCFWAYVIGSFCSILSTMDLHGIEFRQNMDELNYMMADLNLPTHVRTRCRMYFHQSRRLQRVGAYHNLENRLSPPLRRELKVAFYLPTLKHVWFLNRCHDDLLMEVALLLEGRPREASVRAVTFCNMYSFSKDIFSRTF